MNEKNIINNELLMISEIVKNADAERDLKSNEASS